MRKTYLLFTAFVICVSFFACKKDKEETPAPTPGPSGRDSLSLKTGDKWTYKTTKYNEDGTIDTSYTEEESITGTQEISGSTWYTYQTPSAVGAAKFKSDGFWTIFMGSESIRYKFPAAVGDSYVVNTIPGKVENLHVVSISESVTVIAGTFTCYHYRDTTDSQEPEHDYYAPKVGVIKKDEFDTKSDNTLYLKERKELVSFVKAE